MARSWFLNAGAAVMLAVGFGALFFSAAGDTYANPSLVVNGTFDDDVNGWTEVSDPDADFSWDSAVDVNNNPDSGSGLLRYTGAGSGSAEVISDCFALAGDATYPYEAWVRPHTTDWTTDDSSVDIHFVRWENSDCTGSTVTNAHGATTIGNAGGGWVQLSGSVIILGTENQGMQLVLRVNAEVPDDAAWWDEVKIADTELDTPTPQPTNTATNTPSPTNTQAPTNTPAATNTPEPTATEVPTDTPMPTNTATNTPVPPTATNTAAAAPPESELETTDDAGSAQSGIGSGGEQPEDGNLATGEEVPEGQEFPESGTGPGSYGHGGSATADVIATFSFALAIAMLGAGFYLRRKYEEQ